MEKQTPLETALAGYHHETDACMLKEDYDGETDEPPSLLLQLSGAVSPLEDFRSKKKKYSIGRTSPLIKSFRRHHYPFITTREWNDWRWQIRNRIRTAAELATLMLLSEAEQRALSNTVTMLPVAVTPYYAALIDRTDPDDPIRRCVIPTEHELLHTGVESDDPLHEEIDSPVPGLVHRYPDRVLFLTTDFCSTYCRYCTRSRRVGHDQNLGITRKNWDAALDYIEQHTEIRDVLISGGDPLTLSDEIIDWLLNRLRRIPHVEIIRAGTKVPAVLPQRITDTLVRVLKKYHPLWINIHFTHPRELTPESQQALARLADAGIPLGSQTVLLKGINDDVATMKSLYHALLRARVRPYYLYQCDPISGSAHFRTPVAKGIEIIQGLRGHTTGLAVPHYVIDAPEGGGKIPLLPDYFQARESDDVVLKNYAGRFFRYPDSI